MKSRMQINYAPNLMEQLKAQRARQQALEQRQQIKQLTQAQSSVLDAATRVQQASDIALQTALAPDMSQFGTFDAVQVDRGGSDLLSGRNLWYIAIVLVALFLFSR